MEDIVNKISLIVCQKCEKQENESDTDFAVRLYNTYNSCYDKLFSLECAEPSEEKSKQLDEYLDNFHL